MTRPFRFKQFSLKQDRCAMKVGFDAVLLGAWVDVTGVRRILDVGTGCGVIALMLAQRAPEAIIDAVEIDAAAAAQAKENVCRSPWGDRVTIFPTAIQEHEAAPYDLIVSNPPFFTAAGTRSPGWRRRRARQDEWLSAADLLSNGERLLAADGRLACIWPVTGEETIAAAAQTVGLHLQERVSVTPNPRKPAHRLLLVYSQRGAPVRENKLALETGQHHVYSPEFAAMTADFYLDKPHNHDR